MCNIALCYSFIFHQSPQNWQNLLFSLYGRVVILCFHNRYRSVMNKIVSWSILFSEVQHASSWGQETPRCHQCPKILGIPGNSLCHMITWSMKNLATFAPLLQEKKSFLPPKSEKHQLAMATCIPSCWQRLVMDAAPERRYLSLFSAHALSSQIHLVNLYTGKNISILNLAPVESEVCDLSIIISVSVYFHSFPAHEGREMNWGTDRFSSAVQDFDVAWKLNDSETPRFFRSCLSSYEAECSNSTLLFTFLSISESSLKFVAGAKLNAKSNIWQYLGHTVA